MMVCLDSVPSSPECHSLRYHQNVQLATVHFVYTLKLDGDHQTMSEFCSVLYILDIIFYMPFFVQN